MNVNAELYNLILRTFREANGNSIHLNVLGTAIITKKGLQTSSQPLHSK